MRAKALAIPGPRIGTWGTLAHSRYTLSMRNEFTAVIERDGDWYVAWSPEIPGANGQGRKANECRQNLREAIRLILDEQRKSK